MFEGSLFINFSRAMFFVFMSTQVVNIYLSYLPVKQIWQKTQFDSVSLTWKPENQYCHIVRNRQGIDGKKFVQMPFPLVLLADAKMQRRKTTTHFRTSSRLRNHSYIMSENNWLVGGSRKATDEILSGKNAWVFLVCGFLMKSFKNILNEGRRQLILESEWD